MPNRERVATVDPQYVADLQASAAAEQQRHAGVRIEDLSGRGVQLGAEVRRLERVNAELRARVAELEAVATKPTAKKAAAKKTAGRP